MNNKQVATITVMIMVVCAVLYITLVWFTNWIIATVIALIILGILAITFESYFQSYRVLWWYKIKSFIAMKNGNGKNGKSAHGTTTTSLPPVTQPPRIQAAKNWLKKMSSVVWASVKKLIGKIRVGMRYFGNQLKKLGSKARASVKKLVLWIRDKSRWFWQKTWPLLKKWSKWLWSHKTEKRVWVSACALAVLTLLFFIGLALYNGVKNIALGPSHMSWLAGILTILLGVFFLLFEGIIWVLVWQKVFNTKTVLKVHGWVLGTLAVLAGIISLLFFVPWSNTFVRLKTEIVDGFHWYWNKVPYPLAIAIAFLCLIAFILIKIKGGRQGTSGSATLHSGEKRSTVGNVVLAVIVMYGLWMIASLFMLGREQHERRNLGKVMIVASATNLPRTDTYPLTANVWTPVVIGERIDAVWHAPGKYIFRYNTEQREYEDSPDLFIKMPKRRGPYTVLFRAKEFPTTVSVYQAAMP